MMYRTKEERKYIFPMEQNPFLNSAGETE